MKKTTGYADSFETGLCENCGCIHLVLYDRKGKAIAEMALPDSSWDKLFADISMRQKERGLGKPS